ncbi:hypothetical protein CPAR01_03303 [Colletotrichum paranaense]|uniref:C2H2-type domain-containing protein n=2 Tax=Colletotrichum acutatum species complex TaxID=2707335 RepID=A0ABQ9T1Y0_9PEZI|nr:uncharacterized protein CPAR01_03303 [Colletotrichum paranaense]KAK1545801.1 hypothetical protein CPAR01_03303 [Colletotrichum paranaense]
MHHPDKPPSPDPEMDFLPVYSSGLDPDRIDPCRDAGKQREWSVTNRDSASGELSPATPKDTTSLCILNELVLKALRDLEIRLEHQITQDQNTLGRGGGKASARKRDRQSSNSQQSPSSKRQLSSKRERASLIRDENDSPNDEDKNGSSPEEGHDGGNASDAEHKYLACPLFRKDPRRYAACAKCRLRRIRDVKQHMRRRHRRPQYYCPICWKTYSGPDERDEHVIERSCSTPQETSTPWITREQDTRLEGRVPNGSTVEQWYTVWDIVCPGQTRPNPPHCFLGKMVEDFSTLRRELWEEHGREIVEELVTQREATLREPLSWENRSLLQRCIIDIVRHVLEHPDVTSAGKVRWNQGVCQSEAGSVPQSPGRVHGVPQDGPDTTHHQPFEMQENLLQEGHKSAPDQGLQFGGPQLGDLDLTSWLDLQTFDGFDTGNLSFLDAGPPALDEGHETVLDFSIRPTNT